MQIEIPDRRIGFPGKRNPKLFGQDVLLAIDSDLVHRETEKKII